MIHLRSQTSSILFSTENNHLAVMHWGHDLGGAALTEDLRSMLTAPAAHGNFDKPVVPGVMREHSRAFLGHPTISGHRNGKSWSTHFEIASHKVHGNTAEFELTDAHAQLALHLTYTLNDQGILRIHAAITNTGKDEYALNEFNYWLPLPDRANQILDFTGRWIHERHPQRRDIPFGLSTREGREGRSGFDFTIVEIALNKNTNFQSGEAWGISLAWSGNSLHFVERGPNGDQAIGTGELLLPGEIIIAPGKTHTVPPAVANYSNEGIDGLSHNYHASLRARPTHPTNVRPRPITLNMWEAVYFDHNEAKIRQLVDVAAEIGVERVVLDDGWFGSRRDDHQGLGDWVLSKDAWPEGLAPLIKYINEKGIEFGLWFEGEMVQVDSDLYRAHPDWIMHEGDRIPPFWRRQQVLDLTHEGAFNHVLGQVDAVLSEYNIAYIKWDHNRVLIDAGHLGHAAVHNQTLAIYRLFDELKRRHPGLEIESCSSGGARVDLGMVDHADRFWTSDNNDALDRQTIQRWTSIAIPPEMLGTHVGPVPGHQTGRSIEINFRAINALFGHAGIEWDITQASDTDRKILKKWIDLYKSKRSLLHSGKSVRVEHPDSAAFVYGVIALDKSEAIFAYMQHALNTATFPANMIIPGLDPNALYRVKQLREVGKPMNLQLSNPGWMDAEDGILVSGRALESMGLKMPVILPTNGVLVSIVKA